MAATRRAFLAVTALRYLPTGLFLPTLVLYMSSAGLSLAQIGLVMAMQGAVVLLLELPTGGLADAWGRRPVLACASVVAIASTAVLLFADSPAVFALAWGLQGIYRALASGPLDSWYVDAALAADPRRDIEKDLAAAGGVVYSAIATGSLLAAGLTFLDGLPVGPLVAALVLALGLEVLHLVGIMLLVREFRPGGRAGGRAAAMGAPAVVGTTLRLGWNNRSLRLLLAVELSWGAGLVALELLWQPRTRAELDGPGLSWVFGAMSASAWLAGTAGALLLPALLRLLKGRVSRAAALMRLIQGATLVALGLVGGLVGVVAGYMAFYIVHGAANPAHSSLLHRRASTEHRTTVLSLNSLLAQGSGIPAAIVFGALADGAGIRTALVVAGVLLATATPLYLLSGEPPRSTADPAPSPEAAAAHPERPLPEPN